MLYFTTGELIIVDQINLSLFEPQTDSRAFLVKQHVAIPTSHAKGVKERVWKPKLCHVTLEEKKSVIIRPITITKLVLEAEVVSTVTRKISYLL